MRPFVYQRLALNALAAARKRGRKRALVVMATGLGKTVVCGFDLERLMKQDPGRVLFLSHDTNINAQARKTFEEILGKEYSHGNFNGKEKHLHRVDFLYATLQTMANHRESFSRHEFKYVVLDEAHHGEAATFKPTLEYFLPDFFLAVTATPERGDNKDITEFFGKPVYRLGVFKALARKYLCKVDYRLMTDDIQNLEVLDTPAGKLSIAELNRRVFIPKRDEEIVRTIAEKTKDIKSPRVMIFCSSIEHAKRMAALMPHAALLHSKLKDKKEVARKLEDFRTGKINTVVTVDMLNEGIDVPEANVLVFLRSTSSRTIFLQQFGRGLRKLLGKDYLLVLDFVANCERIEMIDWLIEGTKRELARVIGDRFEAGEIGSDGGSIEDVLNLHLEGSEFDERLVRLVKIVHEVKEGYTEEALIRLLNGLVEKLGRTPTQKDANEACGRGECASANTFQDIFGSWNAALKAAGMKPTREVNYSQEVLIQLLKDLAEKLGRPPTQKDINEASKRGECPTQETFRRAFGNWSAALRAARMQPTRGDDYSEEALIQQLKALAEKLGRTPTQKDASEASRRRECTSVSKIQRTFGSWNAALRAAGMEPTAEYGYSEEALIQQLKALAEKLGRTPTQQDINEANMRRECANVKVFRRAFGTVDAAHEAAGITPIKFRYSKEEVIQQLKALAEKLGRTPRAKDADEASKRGECPTAQTCARLLGSWNEVLVVLGRVPEKRVGRVGRAVYTEEILIQQLKDLAEKLGRTPTLTDVNEASKRGECASDFTFKKVFERWSAALEAAGLKKTKEM